MSKDKLDCAERAELVRLDCMCKIQAAQLGHLTTLVKTFLKNPITKNKFKIADYLDIEL